MLAIQLRRLQADAQQRKAWDRRPWEWAQFLS